MADKKIQAARDALAKIGTVPFMPRELPAVIGGLLDTIENLEARLQALEQERHNERNHRHGKLPE